MELVTEEIATAINSLSISQSSFRLLSDGEAKPLFDDLLNKFAAGTKPNYSKTFPTSAIEKN